MCAHNISAKFEYQPNRAKHFWVMALELSQIEEIRSNSFHLILTKLVQYMCNVFWPSSITSQVVPGTIWLWPLNYPKLALSTLLVKEFSSNLHKMCRSITSQIVPGAFGLWPLNYPKLPKLALSALEVEQFLSHLHETC